MKETEQINVLNGTRAREYPFIIIKIIMIFVEEHNDKKHNILSGRRRHEAI